MHQARARGQRESGGFCRGDPLQASNKGDGMKQTVTTILIAALVSGIVMQAYRHFGSAPGAADQAAAVAADSSPTVDGERGPGTGSGPETTAASAPAALRYTDALTEDVWVDGSRQSGDDHRVLTNAEHSICFITKIEISGIAAPEDSSACSMQIDDFTGFWDLVATVEEGSQAQIRCNARCLIWE